ncbi:MAG TPA: hypothetical protein VGI58_07235 [Streptosporangiaceae bacterium]
MAPECQEKNVKGLTMVAVGMNKAAEEFMILDEQTREDLASGKYRDQRRGYFGSLDPAVVGRPGPGAGPEARPATGAAPAGGSDRGAQAGRDREPAGPAAAASARRPRPRLAPAPVRKPWSARQERLALLYNEQGLRPDEIGAKLGISAHLATQIVLAARNRRKA